jgi:hypothetical protein
VLCCVVLCCVVLCSFAVQQGAAEGRNMNKKSRPITLQDLYTAVSRVSG